MRWCLAAAVAAVLTLGLSPSAGAAVTPVTGSGSAFADSVGVNIHEFYPDTSYWDKPRLKSLLVELGVKHVRDGLRYQREPYVTEYPSAREIAAAGIKFLWVVGSPAEPHRPDEAISLLTDPARLGGTAEALEGPNEYDSARRPNPTTNTDPLWAANLLAYQGARYAAFKAHPAFSAMPFWGPSFMRPAGRDEYAAQPGAGTLMDRPNAHAYPGGRPPEAGVTNEVNTVATRFGDVNRKPVVTETGYHTAVNNGNWGHFGVSERAQSIYTARALLTSFALGVPRTYLYQLLDQKPEPGLTDAEEHFGLVAIEGTGTRQTWTIRRKAAFNTLKEILEITRDGGTGTRPASLDHTLTGAPSTLRRVLLARSDGSVDLVLWNAVPVYKEATWDCNDSRIPAHITDPHARCEYAKYELAVDAGDGFPADVPVGLQLARAADVSVERPHSQTEFTPLGRGSAFTIDVGPDPVFVRIRP
jgi:hypothetical protein